MLLYSIIWAIRKKKSIENHRDIRTKLILGDTRIKNIIMGVDTNRLDIEGETETAFIIFGVYSANQPQR